MQRPGSTRGARFRWWAAAAGALLLLLLAPHGVAAQDRTLPLDPLTDRERQTAISLATGDERVRRIAAGREFDVGYAELLVVKAGGEGRDTPERPAVAGRFAEVLIAVFQERFQGIRAVVDLGRGAVTEVTTRGGRPLARGEPGFTVPFTPRERALGRELALANADIRRIAEAALQGGELEVEGLPITQVIPGVCPSGRCMEMIFRRGDTYLTSTVIVDIPSRVSRFRRGPQ